MKKITIPVILAAAIPGLLHAHGSMEYPVSRVLQAYGVINDAKPPAWAAQVFERNGRSPYYTWNQVSQNIPAASSGNTIAPYASVVPAGTLASGNVASYSGLDEQNTAWPATVVRAGDITLRYKATAVHNPSVFHLWITKEGYDASKPATWADLEYLGKADATQEGYTFLLKTRLPLRSGRHVLYCAWQRIDPVGEVFFSYSDITFDASQAGGDSTPVTTVSTSPASPPPVTPESTPTHVHPTPTPVTPAAPVTPVPTAPATGVAQADVWNRDRIYTAGDTAAYNGKTFRAGWWVLGGDNPEAAFAKDAWAVWRPLAGAVAPQPPAPADPTPTTTPVAAPTPPAPTAPALPTTPPVTNNGADSANAWNAAKTYTAGDIVSFGGKNYRAGWWVRGGDNPQATFAGNVWGVWRPFAGTVPTQAP